MRGSAKRRAGPVPQLKIARKCQVVVLCNTGPPACVAVWQAAMGSVPTALALVLFAGLCGSLASAVGKVGVVLLLPAAAVVVLGGCPVLLVPACSYVCCCCYCITAARATAAAAVAGLTRF